MAGGLPLHTARKICERDVPACLRLLPFEFPDPPASRMCADLVKNLFREGALYGAIAEQKSDHTVVAVATGLSFFLSDHLFRALVASPSRLFDSVLLQTAHGDPRAVLRPPDIARHNATGALHLFCVNAIADRIRGTEAFTHTWLALARTGSQSHSGYHLASYSGRASRSDDLEVLQAAGGRILNTAEGSDPPWLVGMLRQETRGRPGAWASPFFEYTPPVFRFSEAERTLLLLAVDGLSDPEIAQELQASPSTVKKRWESVYERVLEIAPGLLPEPEPELEDGFARGTVQKRGPEKRRRLIRYLTRHAEELRPYDSGG